MIFLLLNLQNLWTYKKKTQELQNYLTNVKTDIFYELKFRKFMKYSNIKGKVVKNYLGNYEADNYSEVM